MALVPKTGIAADAAVAFASKGIIIANSIAGNVALAVITTASYYSQM